MKRCAAMILGVAALAVVGLGQTGCSMTSPYASEMHTVSQTPQQTWEDRRRTFDLNRRQVNEEFESIMLFDQPKRHSVHPIR